jgi:L-arabinose transport system permease protein
MSDDRLISSMATESDASARFARANLARQIWDSAGMLVIFLALFTACAICIPFFFTRLNLESSLPGAITTVGIVGCTMLFCLAAGDFDLSVGSVVALSGVVAALVLRQTHSPFLGVLAGVVVGGAVGLFNGIIIAQLGVNALIATLATMQIARGLALICCDGKSVGVSDQRFTALGTASIFGMDLPIWIMIGCFIFFGLLLHRTIFGRNTLAIGGNREAAKLAGIPVTRTKIVIFTAQGLVAGFAGVILAAQLSDGVPDAGTGLELSVISACVLGGVSLTGGVGTILAVIVGTLIMGTVQNAMSLKNIPSFYQLVISGSILLAAVLLDRLKQARAR